MPHLYVNGSPVIKHSNTNKGVTEVCVCVCIFLTTSDSFVPGLSEGVPRANRACAGRQPAAGPAVPAGDRGQRRQQGEGAAGPVQHPHRCTGRQLMNSHHRPTHTARDCLPMN